MNYQWHPHLNSRRVASVEWKHAHTLLELLNHVGSNPLSDCELVVDSMKKYVHTALQTTMQLSKGKPCGIGVSGYVPDQIREIIEQVPDLLLRILALYPQLKGSKSLLNQIADARGEIYKYLNIKLEIDSINSTENNLVDVLNASDKKVKLLLEKIVKSPADLMGSYSPLSSRIEIYWVPIFVVSLGLSVPLDRLAYVVLVHELAHYYSHAGKDADNNHWQTDHFVRADNRIVEGIAQFWTDHICQKFNRRLGLVTSHSESECFFELLKRQDDHYSCFKKWLPDHPRRIEAVRGAMLKIREEVGVYRRFEELLRYFDEAYNTR